MHMHTVDANNPMKLSNMKCKIKHLKSTMVICGNYILEFNVNKDMRKRKKKTLIKGEFHHIF